MASDIPRMKQRHGVCRARVQWHIALWSLLALLAFSNGFAASPKTVLVMGDSLAAGYGLSAHQGWVSLLAVRMKTSHPGWRVVNASISGETSAGGAARIAAALAREKPAVVIIELGANDGLRGLSLQQTTANLDAMLRAAKKSGAKVLLIGMRLPPNYGLDYTHGFEQTYMQLAKQYKPAFLPFLLAPIANNRNNFQEDNLHPIASVQPLLRDYVWKTLQPLLQ